MLQLVIYMYMPPTCIWHRIYWYIIYTCRSACATKYSSICKLTFFRPVLQAILLYYFRDSPSNKSSSVKLIDLDKKLEQHFKAKYSMYSNDDRRLTRSKVTKFCEVMHWKPPNTFDKIVTKCDLLQNTITT